MLSQIKMPKNDAKGVLFCTCNYYCQSPNVAAKAPVLIRTLKSSNIKISRYFYKWPPLKRGGTVSLSFLIRCRHFDRLHGQVKGQQGQRRGWKKPPSTKTRRNIRSTITRSPRRLCHIMLWHNTASDEHRPQFDLMWYVIDTCMWTCRCVHLGLKTEKTS